MLILTIILNDRNLSFEGVKHIHVFNKSDIKSPDEKYDISISAKTGKNVKDLKDVVYNTLISNKVKTDTLLTSKRQYNAIKKCIKTLKRCLFVAGS